MISHKRNFFLPTAESLLRETSLPEIRRHNAFWPVRSMSAGDAELVRQWLLTHKVARPIAEHQECATGALDDIRSADIQYGFRLRHRLVRSAQRAELASDDVDKAAPADGLEIGRGNCMTVGGLNPLPLDIMHPPEQEPTLPSADVVHERRAVNRAKPIHPLRRKCVECGGPLPPRSRTDREFCGKACIEKARRCRVEKREEIRIYTAEMSIMQFSASLIELAEDYAESAALMGALACRRGFEVEIVATPHGIIVAADTQPTAAEVADRSAMISRYARKIVEVERLSTDLDVIVFIRNALQQPYGMSFLEQERCEAYRSRLKQILNGPVRSIRIFSFGDPLPDELVEEGTQVRQGLGPEALRVLAPLLPAPTERPTYH